MVEHDVLVYSKNLKETTAEDQRAIETFKKRVIRETSMDSIAQLSVTLL